MAVAENNARCAIGMAMRVAGGHRTVRDGNGSAAGCGNYTANNRIRWIQIGEDDAGEDTCRTTFID